MNLLTRKALLFRWIAAFAVLAILAWAGMHHANAGLKGAYVPLWNVAVCIVAAAIAAIVCLRAWSAVAAPAAAGITGAFLIGSDLFTSFGGVVGLLVGLVVVLVPASSLTSSNAADRSAT
jgi:hypothetical protein